MREGAATRRRARGAPWALAACLACPALAAPQDAPQATSEAPGVVRQVGRVTIAVDARHGRPGGLFVVRLSSRGRLGAANAILDGRRLPFRAGRALVPVSAQAPAGPTTLGVEIFARYGRRQRIPVELELAPSSYSPRSVVLPAARRELVLRPEAVRDGRLVLRALRELSGAALQEARFTPPVAGASGTGFGGLQSWLGTEGAPAEIESLFDGIAGEYHHGLDYDVPPGTRVRAPASGRVALAAHLTLGGLTLVVDHGEDLASVFFHLGTLEVAPGQLVRAGDPLGRSGDTGLSAYPHVHWGTYLHAVPVDPRVLLAGLPD